MVEWIVKRAQGEMCIRDRVTTEADGEVLEICVADGDLVEFGSCLMRIG